MGKVWPWAAAVALTAAVVRVVTVERLLVGDRLEVWHRRREPAARFVAGVVALNLALYVAYYFQSPRFMLPAAALIVVFAAAWVGRIVTGLRDQAAQTSINA